MRENTLRAYAPFLECQGHSVSKTSFEEKKMLTVHKQRETKGVCSERARTDI